MTVLLHEEIRTAQPEQVTIFSVLDRGVHEIAPEEGLGALMSQRQIKLYLGIDPTSTELHIGHAVPLRKLRQFQQLGHHVVLLIGSFTGMIGDPSDRTAARVQLTAEQVAENAKTYLEQAGMILDLSDTAPNPIEVVYNHEWLEPMNFAQIVDLASNFTVAKLLERESFRNRMVNEQPLYLHEFLYTTMQAQDALVLGVDLEVGGKDQLPNMLAGRDLMKARGLQKWCMALKLIEDPNGAKMGKTAGNVVNLTEWPEAMYEALMTWPDSAIALGLELLTSVPMNIVLRVQDAIANGTEDIHPMHAKEALAWRVVSELTGKADADLAEEIFDRVKRQKKLPPRMKQCIVGYGSELSQVLVECGLCVDENEALAKMAQGAIWINGQQCKQFVFDVRDVQILGIGKNPIRNLREIFVR